ncbi:RNA-binding protein [Patescibacteria group bacterium]|nr:RNA-binding protein [Patescibacteria group bacterium]MCL5409777.1 RNA-binding protein [Patescibacteria group bacterium]
MIRDLIDLKKLYIGNLPWSVNDAKLRELFGKYGSIATAVVILDRQTGRSRGFGFVEIEDDSQAQQAISEMNGADIEGRKLVVNEARPKEETSNRYPN